MDDNREMQDAFRLFIRTNFPHATKPEYADLYASLKKTYEAGWDSGVDYQIDCHDTPEI